MTEEEGTDMDFKKLTSRYKQFGGFHLVREYVRLGVMPSVLTGLFRCLYKRQSFKTIYPAVLRKIEPILIEQYENILRCKKEEIRGKALKHEHPKVIWWCWLQGIESIPPVVEACYNSLVQAFMGSSTSQTAARPMVSCYQRDARKSDAIVLGLSEGYEIKVIDAKNWKEYIELPDYIVEKWEKKQIPPALFSDLLRLQLLIEYGGTWIDSTVLCTGFKGSKLQEFKKYLDADLFLFQYTSEKTTGDISISNWFISAHSNNEVLIVLRDMLFAYWKDYNCTLDYYIFHLFFAKVAKEYPEQIAAMPYGYSVNSLVLLHHWGEQFDQNKWDKLVANVCFHKLAFRVNEEVKTNKNNYFNHILETYGCI